MRYKIVMGMVTCIHPYYELLIIWAKILSDELLWIILLYDWFVWYADASVQIPCCYVRILGFSLHINCYLWHVLLFNYVVLG